MEYRISWETQLDAENPLAAAKEALAMIQDGEGSPYQFYVQAEDKKVFSVDLSEDDEDAVLPVENYLPIIR